MSTIYLISDYGRLSKSNKVFSFTYPDGCISKFFPHNTERIFISGNIEITPDAMKMLMHHKIEVIFLHKNSRFNGKIVYDDAKNVLLRKKQYAKSDDKEFTLQWAKNIVRTKIKNQLMFVARIKRMHPAIADLYNCVATMKSIAENLQNAQSLNEVRGYEGAASKRYFGALRYAIIPQWAEFKGRSMNPPLDNVNAVLSFTYTLLNHIIESYLLAEGLDTCVGYLHGLEYGRKSLIFDIMEEFRSPICDTLAVSLFNLGVLNKDDFRFVDFSSVSDEYPLESDSTESDAISIRRGVLLTKDGLKKSISKFEDKLEEQYYYPPAGKSISYRKIIAEQVKECKRVINDEKKNYIGFEIK